MIKNLIIFLIGAKIKMLYLYWGIKRHFITPKFPVNKGGKVYVNLGCGANTSKEFINVDTVPLPHIHHINNIQQLFMFPDNSVDLIYASHVIEHIPRSKLIKSLKNWHRALKTGGILRFGVPNFDKLIEVYQASERNVNSVINQLMGSEGEHDDHHTIWNLEYTQTILKEVGFKETREWNYKDVEHHDFKDKTSRIMKAGNKEILISLNLEAIK